MDVLMSSGLLFMVPMILIFYFLMIRPQRKKDKQVKEMLNNLKAGDRICTIGGIYGTIVGIKDDTVTLSVGRDNLTMVVARWGIRSVEEQQPPQAPGIRAHQARGARQQQRNLNLFNSGISS